MFKKLLVVILVCVSFVTADIFQDSSSLIFNLPAKKWTFEFAQPKYNVSVAGYLTGKKWTNSPVIIYCELIPTSYQFDLFTKIQKMQKTGMIKEAVFKPSSIKVKSPVAYEITYWNVPELVYEYVAYFSLNERVVASLSMSAKTYKQLMKYLPDYQRILANFAKVSGAYRE